MSPRSTSSPQAHLSQQQIQGSGHFNRGVKHRMTVSKSKPGAWALTLLLVLQEAEQELDGEEGSPQAGPEEEDGGEAFSFKYSPGKLRGNQYKKMMTKEELEEEQRIELTSDLTSL
nr:PREDICTED: matrix-remodeling-associated protein 7 isoform X2 [Bos mutus]